MNLLAINLGTSKVVVAAASPRVQRAVEIALTGSTPKDWMRCTLQGISEACRTVSSVDYLAVCATGGTFLVVDRFGNLMAPASHYNEPITIDELALPLDVQRDPNLRARILAAPALMRLRKFRMEHPAHEDVWAVPQATWLAHQFVGTGTAQWAALSADEFNLRKFGVQLRTDLTDDRSLLFDALAIPHDMVPSVVPIGTRIGRGLLKLPCGKKIAVGAVYHGGTDTIAESMFLLGDRPGACMISGSTTTIKATAPTEAAAPPAMFSGRHPLCRDKAWLTSWVTSGENIRRISQERNIPIAELMEGALELRGCRRRASVKLGETPANIPPDSDPYVAVRAVIDAMLLWEKARFDALSTGGFALPNVSVAMMGGMTRNTTMMTTRARVLQRPLEVYPASGAIGALVPGLLCNGQISTFGEFADNFRSEPLVYT